MARPKRKVNPLFPTPAPEPKKQRIFRAGGYARLSVEDGRRPGADTIAVQKELIQGYIAVQPDMKFCGLYCDNGQTGTNFERPGFERLLNDVKAGKIDCIVVKDLSRFGRNYRETGNYLERIFPFLDVRFVAVNDHFDTATAERSSDGYIIPLKNIINEVYSKDISRKSGSALAIKQQNGDFIGTWAAYGYRKRADNPNRIEIEEETAPIVRQIFRWRLEGMAYVQIARKLNELGIPSPARYHYLKGDASCERYAEAKWHQQTVKKILSSEVYLGHMVQGRKRESFYEGKPQELRPKDQWTIVKNTHEPLIEEEIFQAVQQMAERQQAAYNERLGKYAELGESPNILKGLIFCADCKRPLVRYKSVTNRGKNLAYVYICPSHADNPENCPKKYLHETVLKEILWDVLQNQIALAGNVSQLLREAKNSGKLAVRDSTRQREEAAVRRKLERAGMLYDSLYQNYVDRLMTEREYLELKAQYRADMDKAQAHLKELEAQKQEYDAQTVKNPWLAVCGRFQQETELTEGLAHALIERVEVDSENHISITLRYQDEYRALCRLLDAEGKAVAV